MGRHVKPAGMTSMRSRPKFPKERFGNGIDWEKAAVRGLIKPIDTIEGISIKRGADEVQKDFTLTSKVQGMADIIFSHKKHTVWSGCEGAIPRYSSASRKA